MAYKIVPLIQNTPEWETFRKGKIGSSMAAAIMGESPWQTPLQLYEDCVHDRKKPVTPAMQRGKDMEATARNWINRHWKVFYQPVVIELVDYPYMFASLDGFYEIDGKANLLEIKCAGAADHAEALAGRIPKHYQPQLQYQMLIAGVVKMFYLSFVGDDEENVVLLAKRNDEYCSTLFHEATRFWVRLADLIPPDPQERDWVDVQDPHLIEMAKKIGSLRALKREIEAEVADLENQLGAKLTHSRCRIGELKAEKVMRRGNIDYSKIEAIKGLDLESYRRPSYEYWRFF